MHSQRRSGFAVRTIRAVRTLRRLRSSRLRVGAVAGVGLATTLVLLPSAPAFGAGVHHRRPDPPLQAAHVVALGRGGKPVLSKQPADYIPATMNGKAVVLDARSTVGVHTDPSCPIPPEGAVVNPLNSPSDAVQEALGGLWDCPPGVPTGFVAGIDAVKAAPTVSKLSEKSLYAGPQPADAGSVKTTTVKVHIPGYRPHPHRPQRDVRGRICRAAHASAGLGDDALGDQPGAVSHRHAQGGSRQSAAGGLGRGTARFENIDAPYRAVARQRTDCPFWCGRTGAPERGVTFLEAAQNGR
jgi:hypothetical protein